MERYYALNPGKRRVPFVNVRALSNWLHTPLINEGGGKWGQGPVVENFAEGYKYGIVTTSSAVLSTLQLRCERTGAPPSACTYRIEYA
jgi:hypothetical protein